jgi:hypothetical protein
MEQTVWSISLNWETTGCRKFEIKFDFWTPEKKQHGWGWGRPVTLILINLIILEVIIFEFIWKYYLLI